MTQSFNTTDELRRSIEDGRVSKASQERSRVSQNDIDEQLAAAGV